MARRLVHRGPDDFGTWRHGFAHADRDYDLGLGHTRLAILDVSSAGHQPMSSADGRVTVAYNGEIYNFRALRRELAARGHAFRSQCDTEVLIEGYRAWKESVLEHINGMFSFALWDEDRSRLLLARDRLGIKPLYYGFTEGVLAFASEIVALRAHGGFRAVLDRIALGEFLRHGYVPGPRTIYSGVRKLMPGEYLVWEGGGIRIGTFWSLTAPEEGPPPETFDEAVDTLEGLLGEAVEERLISDVPLGAFLSGGVDSSAVVGFMKERSTGPVRTFSIGFEDEAFDEAPHARRVADHLKTVHVELRVRTAEAREVARELPGLYDEPFADSSAIPTVLLSRLTREHVTVALSGDGGDELFGGYEHYGKLKRLLPLMIIPGWLRARIGDAAPMLPEGRLRNALRHLRNFDAAEVSHSLTSGGSDETIEALCRVRVPTPHPVYLETFRNARVSGIVQRAMMADARVYLPDDILVKVDRASMSVGLEVRVPLLDRRIARFAYKLPQGMLSHEGQTKAPLRALLHRRVPPRLIERPKHGFAIPIGKLLSRELRDWKERYLEPARLREEGNLEPDGVSRALREARERGGESEETAMLWRLLSFQRWFERHHRS